jgi:hypothetical protein
MVGNQMLTNEKQPAVTGAKLIAGLEEMLLAIDGFDDAETIRCAAIADTLSDYWDQFRSNTNKYDIMARHRIVSSLNQAYNRNRLTDVCAACAIFVVAAHVEASYLLDEDAEVAHRLTSLYLGRVKSIMQARRLIVLEKAA